MDIQSFTSTDFKNIKTEDIILWNFCNQLADFSVKSYYEKNTQYNLESAYQTKVSDKNGFDYILYIKIYSREFPLIKKFEIFVPNESNPKEVVETPKEVAETNTLLNSYKIVKKNKEEKKKNIKQNNFFTELLSFFENKPKKKIAGKKPIIFKKKIVAKKNVKNEIPDILYINEFDENNLLISVLNSNPLDKMSYFKVQQEGSFPVLEEKILKKRIDTNKNFIINKPKNLSGELRIKYISSKLESDWFNYTLPRKISIKRIIQNDGMLFIDIYGLSNIENTPHFIQYSDKYGNVELANILNIVKKEDYHEIIINRPNNELRGDISIKYLFENIESPEFFGLYKQ